jgi:hypothetical protein
MELIYSCTQYQFCGTQTKKTVIAAGKPNIEALNHNTFLNQNNYSSAQSKYSNTQSKLITKSK